MTDNFISLLLVLTPIALFDSTSITPLCIVPLVMLLGGPKPLKRSFGFLGGIFIAYLASSILIVIGLQSVFERLNARLMEILKAPDATALLFQVAIGLCMVFFGSRMADARESEDDRGMTESVSTWKAFSVGAGLTLVGMPGAFPLFAAVDQLLRAEPSTLEMVLAMVFYNVVFIAPLCGVVLVRVALGERGEPILQRINAFMSKWGHRVVVGGLVIGGAVLVLDAIGWFMGHPLLPTF